MSALADPSDQNSGEARNSRSPGPSPCLSPISNPFSMRCLWVSATPPQVLHLIALVLLHAPVSRLRPTSRHQKLTASRALVFEISDLYSILRIVMLPASGRRGQGRKGNNCHRGGIGYRSTAR